MAALIELRKTVELARTNEIEYVACAHSYLNSPAYTILMLSLLLLDL